MTIDDNGWMQQYELHLDTHCWLPRGEAQNWDYSDGDAVERRLLQLLQACGDRSVLSSELAGKISDWPTRYYFSAKRANLLRPMVDLLRGRVLEIGAGCGAITRYLGETAAEVVALEPSHRRAQVAAARCSGLDNVKVVVEQLERFHATGERFDAVTLIGVLEYAHRFCERPDAAAHWLRLARDLLRPGGVLLVAIENKLGLKYFAGAPEDHLGRPMIGVSDLYTEHGPRTYGCVELKRLLATAGFPSVGVALPFPDYKLPTAVLLSKEEDAMPGFTGGGASLAAMTMAQDESLQGAPLFALDRAWWVLAENGLIADMSNSFLMVAHADPTDAPFGAENGDVSAYYYSVNRYPQFCKQAVFCAGATPLVRRRRLLCDAAPPWAGSYRWQPEDEKFVPGPTWSMLLYRQLAVDGWRLQDVQPWIAAWAGVVCAHAGIDPEQFAAASEPAELRIPGGEIDIVPHNLVQAVDGSLVYIDREWRKAEPLSLGFLLFRGLFETLSSCPPVARPFDSTQLQYRVFISELLALLHPALILDEARIDAYLAQEFDFQQAVVPNAVPVDALAFAAARLSVSPFAAVEGGGGAAMLQALSVQADYRHLQVVHERLEEEHERVGAWAQSLALELQQEREARAQTRAQLEGLLQLEQQLAQEREAHSHARAELEGLKSLEQELAKEKAARAQLEVLLPMEQELVQEREAHAQARAQLEQLVPMADQLARSQAECLHDLGVERECRALLQRQNQDLLQRLSELEVQLQQASQQGLEQQALLRERDNRLAELDAVIAGLQGELTDKTEAAQRIALESARHRLMLETEVHAQASLLVSREGELAGLRSAMTGDREHNQRELAQATRMLEQIVGSQSWRLTRPMRLAGRLARGDWDAVIGSLRHSALARNPLLGKLRVPVKNWLMRRSRGQILPVENLSLSEVEADADLVIGTLCLPETERPVVSVLVPTYGNFMYSLACVRSVAAAGAKVPFEVIVAEDASGDPDIDRLAEIPGLRYYRNPHNLGFLMSCNHALTQARGDYVVFLNNDTEVREGWLDALLDVFRSRADAGLVGAKLIYPDGRQQEAGGIVWADASAWNFGRLQDPQAAIYNYVHEADYISGAAIMAPRVLLEELGGFDPLYLPAYCEDTDLAFRVRAQGLKVYLQPRAVVVHHEGISHGTDTSVGIKAYQVANQVKFRERWKDVLEREHFSNAELPFLARDRSQLRKTVLIIDHYVPQPDRDAGSRTMWQFMSLFLKQDMAVKFWPENLWFDPVYTPRLQEAGVEVYYGHEYGGGFEQWISDNGACIDYVLLSRPHISVNFIDALRRHTDAPLIYYGHDIHHKRLAAQIAIGDGGEDLREEMERMRAMEERVWRQVDTIYYPSVTEIADVVTWLQANALAKIKAFTIPVYAFDSFPVDPASNLAERRNLLFVAGFGHGPNGDAAVWFVNEVLPLIQAHVADVHIHLVGSNPTPDVRALAGAAVSVTGFVTDDELMGYYARSRVVVAPLRYGGGMKGKVAEAMRFGLPTVTSPAGAQGLDDAKSFLAVAESADGFAREVVRLLRDDAEWLRASGAAQDFARSRFSEEALWQVIAEDVDPHRYPDVQARRTRIERIKNNRK